MPPPSGTATRRCRQLSETTRRCFDAVDDHAIGKGETLRQRLALAGPRIDAPDGARGALLHEVARPAGGAVALGAVAHEEPVFAVEGQRDRTGEGKAPASLAQDADRSALRGRPPAGRRARRRAPKPGRRTRRTHDAVRDAADLVARTVDHAVRGRHERVGRLRCAHGRRLVERHVRLQRAVEGRDRHRPAAEEIEDRVEDHAAPPRSEAPQ